MILNINENDNKIYKDIQIKDFVELFLVSLALKQVVMDKNNGTWITKAFIPADYKLSIETIMEADNDWADKFDVLINKEFYQKNRNAFERKLAEAIEAHLKENKKIIEYDFDYDNICIYYSSEEIQNVLNKYDTEIIYKMEYFSELVRSFSIERKNNRETEYRKKYLTRKGLL